MIIKDYLKRLVNNTEELLYAKIWDDTKKGISWIENMPGISPGRWAVGYNYLYVMTRILNELEPSNILELGLGVSTTLISSYVKSAQNKGTHIVIEQDSSWADFYKKKHELDPITNIYVSECVKKQHKGIDYWAYKDISDIVSGKKFDVISIDGPWGEGKYSRRDIIDFIPQILSDDFVIIIDDAGRDGEKQTISEIKIILDANGIKYCSSVYAGNCYVGIITSENNRFLCSM